MIMGNNAARALARLGGAWSAPDATARQKKAEGEPVVGFLGATAPVEMIAASRAYPFRLKGTAPGTEDLTTEFADRLMEPVREAYLRHLFDRMLKGEFQWLDLLVIPRTSEGLLQFYYLLDYAKSLEHGERLPPVYLLDFLQTPHDYSVRYNHSMLCEFANRLEEVTGTRPDSASISQQIVRYNAGRAAFRNISVGGKLDGVQRLKLAAFGQHEPIEDFCSIIEGLAELPPCPSAVRIGLSGSPHENASLYEALAAHGLDVAVEDHDWGGAIYEHDVSEAAEPIEALETRYRLYGISMRQFQRRHPELDLNGEEARVKAVAFYFEENDDTLGWEYPDERVRLERLGIAAPMLRGPVNGEACLGGIADLAARLQNGGTAHG
ncbi:2-hydroxyacyl-CoA dehydratase family protein [Chelativorans sp. J32]|uniref:2-hydroxyacyl-CoA dehydratase family protein n=1 Tax=Chelativorans sp. J32 TaxID=935840 RepID=UPI000481615F|nr:2-hydroxyacyl-CoA dehydratase family protein [Chelativorans sp. J32]